MPTGAIALERLQAGLEAVAGTPVPATRRVYGERGTAWLDQSITKEFLNEAMSSYIKNYRHVVTEVGAKLTIPGWLTAADAAWWLQLYAKGGVAGVVHNTAAYQYTFTSSAADPLRKTATFEGYSDTQQFQLPFCLGEKFEITWQNSSPKAVQFSADLTAQQAIAQPVTAAIADRTGLNAMAGAATLVTIDNAGGTIGTTAYKNVLGGKITLTNTWETITNSSGVLYYSNAASEARSLALELDLHYADDAERAALMADTERLIQVSFVGPAIAGSSPTTTESLVVQFYGYHLTPAFGVSKAIRTLKLTAESQYDVTAGTDWSMIATNAVPTLP